MPFTIKDINNSNPTYELSLDFDNDGDPTLYVKYPDHEEPDPLLWIGADSVIYVRRTTLWPGSDENGIVPISSSSMSNLHSELGKFKCDLSDMTSKFTDAESHLAVKTRELQSTKNALTETEEKLSYAERSVQEVNADLNTAEITLNNTEDANNRLHAELDNERDVSAALRRHLSLAGIAIPSHLTANIDPEGTSL